MSGIFLLMHILLTNDDCIQAPGLWALYDRFVKNHSISVIAPDREQSAIGHAITLNQPLRATRVSMNGNCPGYAVSGTPADCVKLGVLELLESKPDMLISGINPGANVGVNINYSGTVAAAKEAALYGIMAMAVSCMGSATDHYDDVATFVAKLAVKVAENGLPFGTFLNINIPAPPLKGIKIAHLGQKRYNPRVIEKQDPRGRLYYWIGTGNPKAIGDEGSDVMVIKKGYVTVTPLQNDSTDFASVRSAKFHKMLESLQKDIL